MTFRLWRVAALLFGSGACALIYQVAWFRELRLVFGASTASSAAVLAVFMGGLGIGGALLGKRADASPNALRLYANLEIAVALTAAATPAPRGARARGLPRHRRRLDARQRGRHRRSTAPVGARPRPVDVRHGRHAAERGARRRARERRRAPACRRPLRRQHARRGRRRRRGELLLARDARNEKNALARLRRQPDRRRSWRASSRARRATRATPRPTRRARSRRRTSRRRGGASVPCRGVVPADRGRRGPAPPSS